ncbi:MAG: hypothetical protein N2651_06915 [Fimbriimonadales bacterium]|nr:hypothetical protein [Fimbriimonadales bacterium]
MLISRQFGFAVIAALALASSAHASINFVFNTVQTGGTPSGSAPWATMTMHDISGGVQITLNHLANPSAPNQFISELNIFFNRRPTGSDFTGDPFVSSIGRFGGYTDAGLSFNAEIGSKSPRPPDVFSLATAPPSSCSAYQQRTLRLLTTVP